MTRKLLQGIAIGIFFTTLILVFNLYFTDNFQTKNEIDTFSKQDLQAYLLESGLVAVNKTEYEQLLVEVKNKQADELQIKNDGEEDVEEGGGGGEKGEIAIVIKPGTTSQEVGLLLEKKGLIDDYQQFIDYLINNQLETNIKAGEYQLSTEMTLREIVEILT